MTAIRKLFFIVTFSLSANPIFAQDAPPVVGGTVPDATGAIPSDSTALEEPARPADANGTTAAPAEPPTLSPCTDVSCSNHGACILKQGDPVCVCNEGYMPDPTTGLSCMPTQIAQKVTPAPVIQTGSSSDTSKPGSVQEPKKKKKSFFSSVFSAQFEGGVGGSWGDIITEEKKDGKIIAIYDNGTTETGEPSHVVAHVGSSFDLAPVRKRNVRLAIRLGYEYNQVKQSVSVGGGVYEQKDYDERLMLFHTLMFGPALYLGKDWWHITLFFINGPALGGKLRPYPVAQKIDSIDIHNAKFRGWKFDAGLGVGAHGNRLLLGVDVIYSPTLIKLDNNEGYDSVNPNGVNKDSWLHKMGVSFYLGFYI